MSRHFPSRRGCGMIARGERRWCMKTTRWASVHDELLKTMLDFFPGKNGDTVYHYTSLDVLWEFLRPDYDFLCTYCKALSDPTEFKTGMFACTRMWREFCGGNSDKFLIPLSGANVLSGDSGLNFFPWTMSFSLDSDRTSQWKNYTDKMKGGCAVGFDKDKILTNIFYVSDDESMPFPKSNGEATRDLLRNDFISFLPCIYMGYDDADRIRGLFRYCMTEVVGELTAKLSGGGNEDERARNTAQTLIFLLLSSIIKHEDFKDEREWRLIVQPIESSEDVEAVSIVGGKPRVKTRVWGNKQKVRDLIRRIVISPQGPSDNLLETANLFVALRGLKNGNGPLVVPSESPYRGEL